MDNDKYQPQPPCTQAENEIRALEIKLACVGASLLWKDHARRALLWVDDE